MQNSRQGKRKCGDPEFIGVFAYISDLWKGIACIVHHFPPKRAE